MSPLPYPSVCSYIPLCVRYFFSIISHLLSKSLATCCLNSSQSNADKFLWPRPGGYEYASKPDSWSISPSSTKLSIYRLLLNHFIVPPSNCCLCVCVCYFFLNVIFMFKTMKNNQNNWIKKSRTLIKNAFIYPPKLLHVCVRVRLITQDIHARPNHTRNTIQPNSHSTRNLNCRTPIDAFLNHTQDMSQTIPWLYLLVCACVR